MICALRLKFQAFKGELVLKIPKQLRESRGEKLFWQHSMKAYTLDVFVVQCLDNVSFSDGRDFIKLSERHSKALSTTEYPADESLADFQTDEQHREADRASRTAIKQLPVVRLVYYSRISINKQLWALEGELRLGS